MSVNSYGNSPTMNFTQDSRVSDVVAKYEEGRIQANSTDSYIKKIGRSVFQIFSNSMPSFLSEPENSYVKSLKTQYETNLTAKINISILEELDLIAPLSFTWDISEEECSSQLSKLQEQNASASQITEFIVAHKKPEKGKQFRVASQILLELKENFQHKFEEYESKEHNYEWLKKMNKLGPRNLFINDNIILKEGFKIHSSERKTLTFGCGHHQTRNCLTRNKLKKENLDFDAHKDEFTVDLDPNIEADITADFQNLKLFKNFPDNHFQKIWFESMHIGEAFNTKSFQECYRILQPGGYLEINDDDTLARLLKEPFDLEPEAFFKGLGFSDVKVEICPDSRGDYFNIVAIK